MALRIVAKRARMQAGVPTTSMADIAFLLIIFFMLTAVYSTTRGLEWQLPKDDPNQLNVQPMEAIHIHILSPGQYVVDRRPADLNQVGGYVSAKMKQNPDKPVIVQTDPQVPYFATIEVLDLLKQLEVKNISVPTQSEVKRWEFFLGRR
ncbi:MAG: biopolymer transporter ExbD [Acidobacteria bacterium]|nr:biopolymer transporter ExbD [Acidobacteriota bacterium]